MDISCRVKDNHGSIDVEWLSNKKRLGRYARVWGNRRDFASALGAGGVGNSKDQFVEREEENTGRILWNWRAF